MPKLKNHAIPMMENKNAATKAMVLHASHPNTDLVILSAECAPSMAHRANHEPSAVAIAVMTMSVLKTGAQTNAISVRQLQSFYSYGSF